jgi:protein-L-isoaspartate(D-aspartate) O-methyltransferase
VTGNSRKWLTAAECAERTGLTVRALRVYEREGLLNPSRAANGWRRYGPDDLKRLNTISVLKALGLTLAQIGKLLREAAPSLLSVLQVQAKSWRERQGEAAKALELVEAAIHRLERNQEPSLEELCELVNALQERSTPMQERATLMADLMKELLTTEEQWQWQTWWASHAQDMNQNAIYLRERLQPLAIMQELQQQGRSPADSAVQEQVLQQLTLITRYGVRERTVRMMDWNLALTTRFMELGVIARERLPEKEVLPFPLMSREQAQFYEHAMAASAPVRAAAAVISSAQSLLEAGEEPGSATVDTVVAELMQVCARHELGDVGAYLRFTPFICRVNRQPMPALAERTYDFLLQALRLRTLEKTVPQTTVNAPVLHLTSTELAAVRRAYARQMGLMAGVIDPRVEAAFAAVEREKFMGKGPWSIMSILRGTSMTTPDDSPAHLYADNVVSIVPGKRLNNGQPSLYYRLFADAQVPTDAHIVHVGAGTGYYSAILAHITGPGGRVTAIEFEAQLAAKARINLQQLPQVEVIQGNATQVPFAPADFILVSAGASRLVDHWLDSLKDDGLLLLPLTPDKGMGTIFGIRRRGERYFASVMSPVMIYPCAGARDPASEAALAEALKRGGERGVTRLYRGDSLPTENCWLRGENWCLALG